MKTKGHETTELYLNRTSVLMGDVTISLLGFESVYDRRLIEMCITDLSLYPVGVPTPKLFHKSFETV